VLSDQQFNGIHGPESCGRRYGARGAPAAIVEMKGTITGLRGSCAAPACRRDERHHHAMQRLLIALGALFLLAGLLWPWLSRLPWGRLPGDIAIEREGFEFYFPWVTSLVVSLVASLLLWWWWRK
jgi:hypothetical protein